MRREKLEHLMRTRMKQEKDSDRTVTVAEMQREFYMDLRENGPR